MLLAAALPSYLVPLGIIFALVLFLALYEATTKKSNTSYEQAWQKANALKAQLEGEIDQLFLLVATKSPNDENLRKQVILASTYLVLEYSSVNSRRIIGPGDYAARYRAGLAYTKTIREQLGA
jgi:hypothetical protein